MQVEEDAQVVVVTLVQFVYIIWAAPAFNPPHLKWKRLPKSFIRGVKGGEVVKNQHWSSLLHPLTNPYLVP